MRETPHLDGCSLGRAGWRCRDQWQRGELRQGIACSAPLPLASAYAQHRGFCTCCGPSDAPAATAAPAGKLLLFPCLKLDHSVL